MCSHQENLALAKLKDSCAMVLTLCPKKNPDVPELVHEKGKQQAVCGHPSGNVDTAQGLRSFSKTCKEDKEALFDI